LEGIHFSQAIIAGITFGIETFDLVKRVFGLAVIFNLQQCLATGIPVLGAGVDVYRRTVLDGGFFITLFRIVKLV
jgi:hypothetical protein